MNDADRGKVVYRGQGVDAFRRFMGALVQRGKDDTPLVVEVRRETSIIPLSEVSRPSVTSVAQPSFAYPTTVPVTPSYTNRVAIEYKKSFPQRIGDALLIAYATPFALWEVAKDMFRR